MLVAGARYDLRVYVQWKCLGVTCNETSRLVTPTTELIFIATRTNEKSANSTKRERLKFAGDLFLFLIVDVLGNCKYIYIYISYFSHV